MVGGMAVDDIPCETAVKRISGPSEVSSKSVRIWTLVRKPGGAYSKLTSRQVMETWDMSAVILPRGLLALQNTQRRPRL